MRLTAISEGVEPHDPKRKAVRVVENERSIYVVIIGESGSREVGAIGLVADER